MLFRSSLRRVATIAQHSSRAQDGRGDEASASDEDEALPMSLQRVGTRLRQDNTVVRRRRALTVGGW